MNDTSVIWLCEDGHCRQVDPSIFCPPVTNCTLDTEYDRNENALALAILTPIITLLSFIIYLLQRQIRRFTNARQEEEPQV
uniref:Uncharacterized protein n=1 Tax=Steinernema glaseri TaxID=37863 RepID=A0A1I7YPG5_9BILA